MLSLLHVRATYPFIVLDKGFGYALRIEAAAEGKRL